MWYSNRRRGQKIYVQLGEWGKISQKQQWFSWIRRGVSNQSSNESIILLIGKHSRRIEKAWKHDRAWCMWGHSNSSVLLKCKVKKSRMKKLSKTLQIQLFPTLLARTLTHNKRTCGCHHHRADEGKANTCLFLPAWQLSMSS